jgi:hypothetical protein
MKLTRLSKHFQSADCQRLDWVSTRSTDHILILRGEHNGNPQDHNSLPRLLNRSLLRVHISES